MRVLSTALFILLFYVGGAFAQSTNQAAETVKRDILSALSTPLPITVIGPLITNDVKVTADGSGFRAELDNTLLMGLIPLGSLSFKIIPQGDEGNYRITEFRFPQNIEILNTANLGIGSTEFDGLWSSRTRSYQSLNFKLNDVSVLPKNLAGGGVRFGSLALNVEKEGENNATESRFSLSASEVVSNGLPTDDVAIARFSAALKADGAEAVDLYAVLSRFAFLTAMQQNPSAMLRFAESLRAEAYDTVSLNFALDGLAVKSNDGGAVRNLTIDSLTAVTGLIDVTPENWGKLLVNFDAANIVERGYTDLKSLEIASGNATITGSQIPIGATLSAISRLQAFADGQTVRMKATELIDGFLSFGSLAFSSKASGITTFPKRDRDPTFHIGSYSTGFGLEGFHNQQGRIFLDTDFNELAISGARLNSALEERIFQTLNPKKISYNFSISELNEGLLRKLMSDLVISSQQDLAGLAVPATTYLMAMSPVFETKNARFTSDEIDVSTAGKFTFYPGWLLGGLPFEGKSRTSMSGLERIYALIADIEKSPEFNVRPGGPDPTGIAVFKGLLSTMKALSKVEGSNMIWDILYPEAGKSLIVVNGVTLRFPDIASYIPLIASTSLLR